MTLPTGLQGCGGPQRMHNTLRHLPVEGEQDPGVPNGALSCLVGLQRVNPRREWRGRVRRRFEYLIHPWPNASKRASSTVTPGAYLVEFRLAAIYGYM